jgi:hypothetical protein
MKCPHCLVEINPNFYETFLSGDSDSFWSVFTMNCPNPDCGKKIIDLASGEPHRTPQNQAHSGLRIIKTRQTVRPLASSRPPVPPEVDDIFSKDYNESCLILTLSPMASAALSRRCLQNVLREKAGVRKADLSNEIQQIIDSKSLPSHLSESIDAIRNIGNFAAHPLKSTSTGEIVDVEIGEAEWLLDVLEALFDFYFVQPAILKAKRDALNKKLADVGKPPMK